MKTVRIDTVITEVNKMLSLSTCSKQVREGMISVLELCLHETNNYNGFRYLEKREVPINEKPGIVFDETGNQNHVFPDETRRKYY